MASRLHGKRRVPAFRSASFGVVLPVLLLCVQFIADTALADTQTFTATGSYRVGRHDSRADAQRLAILDARPHAIEHAVAYLEKVPAVKQAGITRDKLAAYSIALADFKQVPSASDTNPGGAIVSASIAIAIDPDTVESRLQALLDNERGKAELTRARDKIERYRRDVERDSKRLASLSAQKEIDNVLQHRSDLLELIDTESELARTWGLLLSAHSRKKSPSATLKGSGSADHPAAPQPSAGAVDAEEHRKKGISLNKEGQYDEAAKEFRLALQLVPNLPRGHLGLGAALQGKGDLDSAITEYGTELRVRPEDGDTYNNLGTALQKKGDIEGAISQYRRAIRLAPDEALTHFNLGTALASKGDVDEAINEYRSAVRLQPEFWEAYFELANILKTKGQTAESAEAFRRFLEQAPDTPANQKWIEQARQMLGEIAEKSRRHRREQSQQ